MAVTSHAIAEWRWKSIFDVIETENDVGLKQETICQIEIYFSHFSEIKYTNLKIFSEYGLVQCR